MNFLRGIRAISLFVGVGVALLPFARCAAGEPPKAPLPKVLILGDSISMGYTEPVRKNLAGKADVRRPDENCQHTAHGLKQIRAWLGTEKWDVIHFNWGIWDTHLLDRDGKLVTTEPDFTGEGHLRHTPEQYRDNLAALVKTLEATGARLVWASTTPVMFRTGKRFEDIREFNAVALKLMESRDIAVNDLYEFVLPHVKEWQAADQAHFNPAGNEQLAQRVSESILSAIAAGRPARSGLKLPAAVQWTIDNANPVIKPGFNGDLDARRASAAHVIESEGRFLMYYWGTGTDGFNRICVAESAPGEPTGWMPRGSVLERQPDVDYNINGPSFPFVLPREEGPWLLYVCAWGKSKPDGGIPNRTCAAVSDDRGKTWRYADRNPVIHDDAPYDKSATGSVWVTRRDGKFVMHYTAIAEYYPRPAGVSTGHGDRIPAIGIAEAISDDGLSWTKPYAHWVIGPRRFQAQPYEYICSKPCVIEENGGYRMWVNTFGSAYRVHSLVSPDGRHWTWTDTGGDGELGVGPPGAFDDRQRSYISVLKTSGKYHAWFTGNQFGLTGMGHATAEIPARQ